MGSNDSPEPRAWSIRKSICRYQNIWLFFILVLVGIARFLDSASRPIEYRDESSYLARGVDIVEKGNFPSFYNNPGVSLVHAASYFFLRDSYLGMDLSGRVTAFVGSMCLYLFFLLAVRKRFGTLWMLLAGLLGLLYFPLYNLDNNSSDLLYASLLSVALYLLVRMESEWASRRLLVLFSVVLGISALMRVDGLFVFAALIPVLWFYAPASSNRFINRLAHLLIYGVLPFTFIVFLFAFFHSGVSGLRDILPYVRTYTAFEQGTGQQMRFELQKTGKDPWYEGWKITSEIFGTPEENRYNPIIALVRHPRAWVHRIWWNIRDFYLLWFGNHNGFLATAALLLFWFGLAGQFLQRRFFMGFSILALLVPILPYFLVTFWRAGYLMYYAPVILFCCMCALQMLFEQSDARFRFFRILVLSIALLLAAQLIGYSAKYSGYMTSALGSIGSVDLTEILSAIAILAIFSTRLLYPVHFSRDAKITSMALLIGLWLFGARGIATFAYSDKSQVNQLNVKKVQEAQRNYIKFGFEKLRGEKICTQDPSLPWYARQNPVIISELSDASLKANALSVIGLMNQYGCNYLLWRGADLSGTGLVKPVFAEGNILLLEKNLVSGQTDYEEIVLDDFNGDSQNQWLPTPQNNVEGSFSIQNGVLTLGFANTLDQRDIYIYTLKPVVPFDDVTLIDMRVKISPGTYLTVDVVRDGKTITPRFINNYSGTGKWEMLSLPVGGRLDSLTISLAEPTLAETVSYDQVKIDSLIVLKQIAAP